MLAFSQSPPRDSTLHARGLNVLFPTSAQGVARHNLRRGHVRRRPSVPEGPRDPYPRTELPSATLSTSDQEKRSDAEANSSFVSRFLSSESKPAASAGDLIWCETVSARSIDRAVPLAFELHPHKFHLVIPRRRSSACWTITNCRRKDSFASHERFHGPLKIRRAYSVVAYRRRRAEFTLLPNLGSGDRIVTGQ